VDGVINNATVATLGMVKDSPIEQWDRSYRVNLRGLPLVTREMGIRAMFFLGAEDGMLSHFMKGPLDLFEVWAQEKEEKYPDLFGSDILALIRDIRERGVVALQSTDAVRAARVDRMLFEYYGFFSVWVDDILVKADESILPLRCYLAAADIFNQSSVSREMITLWKYLVVGRQNFRDAKIIPYTREQSSDSRLSYWTLSECMYLKQALTPITAKHIFDSEGKWAIDASLRAIFKAISSQVGHIMDIG
jgi:hypothetical protein